MTGEVIAGRYHLLEPLGRGSMSSVWLAHDDELDRKVAIKTLAPTADRERFEREARAVAALSHPNICGVYDYGEADGKPYMVLECLPGGTLEDKLASGRPLPDEETERYAKQIAAGLAQAHERGLVHRDLKPANVLFDSESRAKIADFGIARMGNAGTLTEAGTVLGTAAYISPEQASGLPATAASDVYSFGVILFRMLTGRLPFVSANAMELVRMNRDDPPPAVEDVRADAPPALAFTANASLAKDPAARPADGAVLLATLNDDTGATMVVPGAAAATQVIRPAGRPRRAPRLLAPLVVLALVLLLGGVALALAVTGGLGDGGGGGGPTTGAGGLSLPNVPSVTAGGSTAAAASTPSTSTTVPTTATTGRSTTAPTTTAHTTSVARTTSARTTTAHTTTAATTTYTPPPPTTTTYGTTTVDTTTATTDTTTTAAYQGTTTAAAATP